jgi:hypothetical protein
MKRKTSGKAAGVAGVLALASMTGFGCGASDLAPTPGTVESGLDAPQGRVVIQQVYGAGSNAGAPFRSDFVELRNIGDAAASLAGLSLQYTSATGPGAFGGTSVQRSELPAVELAPGQSFLIQQFEGSSGDPLPATDLTDPTPINLGASAGKVALVRGTESLGCNGGSVACDAAQSARILDLVGYGTANYFEGAAAAPAPSAVTAIARQACQDTNSNAVDWVVGAPSPRGSRDAYQPCSGGGGTGGGGAGGAGTGGAGTGGAGAGGTSGYAGEGGASGEASEIRIRDLQGRAHVSPLLGQEVQRVSGVVTATRGNGFYMEDAQPDADPATSEGVFVFTSRRPAVAVGDEVRVTARVSEFRPACSSCSERDAAFANLTTTQLDRPSVTEVVASGRELPAPVRIGGDGRKPPFITIDDDALGNVEQGSPVFDPEQDALDFFESLEGMRVDLADPRAVGRTATFSSGREIPVVADGAFDAASLTGRGGLRISAQDFNPERFHLASGILPALPELDTGDQFEGPVRAILDYSFGNYKALVLGPLPSVRSAGLSPERTELPEGRAHELTIASLNLENLDLSDPLGKRLGLARALVENLGAPDVVVLEELQDDSGPLNDRVVTAERNVAAFLEAVEHAGGPRYSAHWIDPVDGRDGGEPGGNIRVVVLVKSRAELTFVARPGASAETANAVVHTGRGPQLLFSPGRLAPTDAAFENSRKPLAVELRFRGQPVFVVANHWNSKGGDEPLFGRFQPPRLQSEAQRIAQATVVATFVRELLQADPTANVIVLGDLNDFEFSAPLAVLEEAGLHALIEELPEPERYTYVFQGNSQALDHIFASPRLLGSLSAVDVVHLNSEFSEQLSDHDPIIARFALRSRPSQLSFDQGWDCSGPSSLGGGALSVGAGYTACRLALRCQDLPFIGDRLNVDVWLTEESQNPWWTGDVSAYVSAPSQGVWHQWVGRASLDDAPRTKWHPLSIAVPAEIERALASDCSDLELEISTNTSVATLALDEVRFESEGPR